MSVPISGQVVMDGAAHPLSSKPVEVACWTVKAPLTNAGPVYIGPSGVTTGTGYQLDPGDVFEYEVRIQVGYSVLDVQPSDVYVIGTAPDKVTWLASP